LSDFFYRAFEEKYRGSRELIKSRLQVYLPFIQPVFKAYPHCQALDVGCGRGEWLELLTEQGFNAKGVDLDDGMLQACRERGLQVENADALAYMQTLPDGSVCIVSGFHIAEHLPFNILQELIKQAKRILVPGGLLILETPNPENISVGTNTFYFDPTHERPLPPELLIFLPEHYGYSRFKVLRLQEAPQLRGTQNPSLINVINGVSPDYAVVAQTQGAPLIMESLSIAFAQNYGLALHTLAERFQADLSRRLNLLETKAIQAEAKAEQAEAKAEQAEAKAEQAEAKAEQAEAKAEQAKAAAHEQAMRLHAVYSSNSWRITLPMRWLVRQWRLMCQHGVAARIKALAKKLFIKKASFVMEPTLQNSNAPSHISITERDPVSLSQISHSAEVGDLSLREQQIYLDLKAVVAEQKRI
jgi:O-antigen chain-terminating methyltransferase